MMPNTLPSALIALTAKSGCVQSRAVLVSCSTPITVPISPSGATTAERSTTPARAPGRHQHRLRLTQLRPVQCLCSDKSRV